MAPGRTLPRSEAAAEARLEEAGPALWHGLHPARVLLVVTGAFVVLALAGWTAFLLADRAQVLRDARSDLSLIAQLLAGHTQHTIEGSDLVLRQIEREIEAAGLAEWTTQPDAWRRLQASGGALPQVGDIYVMGADGQVAAHSMGPETIQGDFSDRDYFRALRERTREAPLVGRRLTGRYTDVEFFSISRRLENPDGSFAGVVVAAIHSSYFQRYHLWLGVPRGTWITILRDDGALVSLEPPVRGVARLPELVAGLDQERPASLEERPALSGAGTDILARRVVGDYPVIVVAGRAEAQILAEWRRRLLVGTSLVAALTLAVGLLARLGLRGLRRQEVMADALRRSNETLEQRVANRTAELVASNEALGQALADKNLLLSEVHHRVKNNLQLVEALLALQSARAPATARDALDAARRRINALGLVHQQLLGTGDVATLSAIEFLRDLCSRLAASFGAEERGITVAVEGEDVALPLDAAIPLGLAANEVLSNAFKHAFPEGRSGHVVVTLHPTADGFRLTIGDDGVGRAVPPPSEGGSVGARPSLNLGDRIIRSLVTQLHGSLAVREGPGTTVEITVPLKDKSHAE